MAFRSAPVPGTLGRCFRHADHATVSMDDPEPSVRGRPVPGAAWEANRARSMGLILSDARDAPFRLAVWRIEVCR